MFCKPLVQLGWPLVWSSRIVWPINIEDIDFSFKLKLKGSSMNRRKPTTSIFSEFASLELGDKRLDKRLPELAELFEKKPGGTICLACGDWATSKAAYRLFDSDRFDEQDILKPHTQETIKRVNATEEPKVLVLHDTTSIVLPSRYTGVKGLGDMGGGGNYGKVPYKV